MKNNKIQKSTARYDIIQVSYKYAMGIDHRQWNLYETCFTDECEFDFSSFSGRPATVLTAKQWRTNVESLNGNFDATAHQMSNHVISKLKKSSATCVTELRAQHWFSQETMSLLGHAGETNWCELGGHYTNELIREGKTWKIARCALTVRWRLGNEAIFEMARGRNTAQ
jgi:hypothetical protein